MMGSTCRRKGRPHKKYHYIPINEDSNAKKYPQIFLVWIYSEINEDASMGIWISRIYIPCTLPDVTYETSQIKLAPCNIKTNYCVSREMKRCDNIRVLYGITHLWHSVQGNVILISNAMMLYKVSFTLMLTYYEDIMALVGFFSCWILHFIVLINKYCFRHRMWHRMCTSMSACLGDCFCLQTSFENTGFNLLPWNSFVSGLYFLLVKSALVF